VLQPQANDLDLVPGPGFDTGSGMATTKQIVHWLATHDREQGFTELKLDEVVRFSVPFVFGPGVELGIWASVMTDTDYAGESSDSQADFTPGLRWLGVEGAWIRESQFTTDISINSGSGVDWMQPVPEPSTAVLAILGALGLGWRLRARTGISAIESTQDRGPQHHA
jgi:PEP-CTERM motif